MPELPEVETIRVQLSNVLPGLYLQELKILDKKVGRYLDQNNLKKIINNRVINVNRRAKILLFEFENNYNLAFHLKMTGQVILNNPNVKYLPNYHTRVILQFSNNKTIYFQDMRKFGWLKVVENNELERKLLSHSLGPEPFSDKFSLSYFKKELLKTTRAIKIFLLDQTKIAGIGNIYANDALFLANIYPGKLSSSLTSVQAEKLFQAIKVVLERGIKLGGASDNDYLNAYGGKGKYQEEFLVYGKAGKKCLNCNNLIKRLVIGGRGTFYCPSCQKMK